MSAKKKTIILGAALGIIVIIAIVFLVSKSQIFKTERAIKDIGTVTLFSENDIISAEKRYNNLTNNQKRKVKNHSTLTNARRSFDRIKNVYDNIDSLSNDDYIRAGFVFKLYENLTPSEKTQITNFHKLEYYFCKEDGCTTIVRSALCYEYCAAHKCESLLCQKGKRVPSNFCGDHACAESNCKNAKDALSNYCKKHRCQFLFCQNKVSGNSSYCSAHQCAVSWCTNGCSLTSIYCYIHD